MMEKADAFDVITDPELASRTTNLKRQFALKLAAQVAYDMWYSYEDPFQLAIALEARTFAPEKEMTRYLLEYSGSIEAKTLEVLRDVGVGSPQIGAVGIGATPQVQQPEKVKPKRGL